MDVRKGYKAFKKGLICAPDNQHVKQYQENTTYEEAGGEICNAGMMHYCLNPMDCLDYYPLIDDNGELTEFCEVKSLDEPVTDDGKKYASKKLHIGARFALRDWISASVDFFKAQIQSSGTGEVCGDFAQQVGGDSAQQVGGRSAQQVGGENSVIVAGQGSRFKAGMNSLIVRYWYNREGNISGYKVAIVDGATIKADTWYKLENGSHGSITEFVEVKDER